MRARIYVICCLYTSTLFLSAPLRCEEWPGWRGPNQNGVSEQTNLPLEWSATSGIIWKSDLEGEGSSSPIVWQDRIFVTAANRSGERRSLYCFDRDSGDLSWKRAVVDENPEFTSPLTGHAASTPVTDGQRVYAWFGNAGVVCFDFAGNQKWQRKLGAFDTELGLASSPVIHGDLLYLLCDHDGDRFRTFDSFLVALNKHTGKEQWRSERPGLFRSWSTPLVRAEQNELVVAGEKQLRAYHLADGKELWQVDGLLEWVAPSPVASEQLIIAMCGRNGPMLAVHGGKVDASKQRLVWQHETGGAYVCSPLIYDDNLYVHDEQGVLVCYDLKTGAQRYQQRLEGTFYSSAVAAEGHIYITNDTGTTFVIQAGPQFKLLAQNELGEEVLSSPAISRSSIILRTSTHLYCIAK